MILALLILSAGIFLFKSYLVMLTWGVVVDNVELFAGLPTFSFGEAIVVTLFATVLFFGLSVSGNSNG